jgi:hypothetical protein
VYSGFQYVGTAQSHDGIVNCLSGITATDTTTTRTTFETVIAKALGVQPLILGACSHQPYGLDNKGMLFWDGTPIDPQKNPAKVADALFGASSAPAPSVNPDVQLRTDLLALTASEIQGMQSELAALTGEQSKLKTHLAAIQALQNTSSISAPLACTTKPPMPTVDQVRAASAMAPGDPNSGTDYFYQEKNFPLLLQAQLELVTQAIICNAAPVIALMPMYATCDFDFTFAGSPGSHHLGLSHTSPQWAAGAMYNSPISVNNFDPTTRVPFAKAQLWFCKQLVSSVVSVLATTDDPSAPGTKVLDNTLIYWMSEIGDGQNHTRVSEVEYPQVPAYLPLVTIGKCGGAIKSGQLVQYPLGSGNASDANYAGMINRPATDLYLTFAKAMGASNVTFPGTTGPVTEVLG